MNDQPSVTDFPSNKISGEGAIQKGDMALIIRLDGTVKTLAFDANTDLLTADPDTMTDRQVRQLDALTEQGEAIFALMVAVQNPLLMRILKDVASNPDVVDVEAIAKAAKSAMRLN